MIGTSKETARNIIRRVTNAIESDEFLSGDDSCVADIVELMEEWAEGMDEERQTK